MQVKRTLLILGAVTALAVSPASSASSENSETTFAFIEEKYKELLAGPHEYSESLIRGNDCRYVASMAGLSALLWRETGEVSYRESALNRLELVVADYESSSNYSVSDEFFMGYPLLTAYKILRDDQALPTTPSFHQSIRAIADNVSGPHPAFVFGDNQSAARTAGMVLARELFPELDADNSYTNHINAAWDGWYDIRDTVENAPHYNRIFLESTIAIAEMTGRRDQLQTPEVEQLFRRMRAHVTPSGLVAAYGDDDGVFAYTQDWPMVFEYAAQLYQDPGYRWAAERVHATQADNELHRVRSAQDLFWLAQASQFVDPALPSNQPPTSGSEVLMRKNIEGEEVVGQLVLTPGRSADAPYLMADLFSENYAFHPHPEQLGAISHYEAGGTVFLRHYARNLRATEESNSVLIADDPYDDFPFRTFVQPGIWQEAVLPTSRIAKEHGLDEFVRELTRPNFRADHASGETVNFFLDHIRLVGPAGEVVLDTFEGSTGVWGSAAQLTADAAVGSGAIRFAANNGSSFHVPAGNYNQEFDIRDYDELRFFWKIEEGATPASRQNTLTFRTDSRGASDMNVEVRAFDAEVTNAFTADVNDAQFAEYTIAGHITKDTEWTRKTLLFDDGPLVVVDSILPGADANGKYGGPIWHMNTELTDVLQVNNGWFAADGFADAQSESATNDRMYVRIANGDDQSVTQWRLRLDTVGSTDDQTLYASEQLATGVVTQFVSLFVPFDNGTSPTSIHQAAIVNTSLDGQVIVTLGSGLETRFAVIVGSVSGVTTHRGDLNLDGVVSVEDLITLQDNIGSLGYWTDGDFDIDGIVTLGDYQTLRAAIGALPGDYDFDGQVTSMDYQRWRDDFGSTDRLLTDGNADGVVNAADYTIWRDHLGMTASTSFASLSIPEPTTLLLLGCTSVGAVVTRRRSMVRSV